MTPRAKSPIAVNEQTIVARPADSSIFFKTEFPIVSRTEWQGPWMADPRHRGGSGRPALGSLPCGAVAGGEGRASRSISSGSGVSCGRSQYEFLCATSRSTSDPKARGSVEGKAARALLQTSLGARSGRRRSNAANRASVRRRGCAKLVEELKAGKS